MEFLKNQYEKICLGVALLALLGWCAFLALSISKAREDIESLRPPPDTGPVKLIPLMDPAKDLPGMQILADERTQWSRKESIFDPPGYIWCVKADCGYLLTENSKKCPYCGTDQPGVDRDIPDTDDSDRDGIPDAVEKKYAAMDPSNPRDAVLDMDDDGFTNLEEYKAGTKMDDASSHPPYAEKLYFVQADQTLLPLRLEKISREGKTPADWVLQFTVNENGRRVTRFARLGETVADFKLIGIASSIVRISHPTIKNSFLEKDMSALTIQRGADEPVVIKPGMAAYEHGVKVRLAIIRNPLEWSKYQFIDTRVGDDFAVSVGMGARETYTVLAAGGGEAKVQIIEGGKPGKVFSLVRFRPPAEAATPTPAVPGPTAPLPAIPGPAVPAIPAVPGPVVPAVPPPAVQPPQGGMDWPSI